MKETQFDRDIALEPISPGHYGVSIADTWNVLIGPNGGYIAAIILKGMKDTLGDVQTRSVTFHFLSASLPGDANLHVNVEKRGRSLSTCTARLTQGDRTIAMCMATFASARESFTFRDFNMPEVPDPEDVPLEQRMSPELVGHVGDVRRDAAGVGGGVTLVPALPRMDDRLQTQVGVQSEEGCQDALEVLGGLSV